jgi:hypothetical protein
MARPAWQRHCATPHGGHAELTVEWFYPADAATEQALCAMA